MLTIEEIKQLIPHREPFLWVDEILELEETSILAKKYLDPALEIFDGHFPNHPVFPGVLQCEAAFQTGAILIAKNGHIEEGKIPVVTRVNHVKFRRMIGPGETMQIAVEMSEQLANAFFMNARISVEGRVCARLEFACAIADAE